MRNITRFPPLWHSTLTLTGSHQGLAQWWHCGAGDEAVPDIRSPARSAWQHAASARISSRPPVWAACRWLSICTRCVPAGARRAANWTAGELAMLIACWQGTSLSSILTFWLTSVWPYCDLAASTVWLRYDLDMTSVLFVRNMKEWRDYQPIRMERRNPCSWRRGRPKWRTSYQKYWGWVSDLTQLWPSDQYTTSGYRKLKEYSLLPLGCTALYSSN